MVRGFTKGLGNTLTEEGPAKGAAARLRRVLVFRRKLETFHLEGLGITKWD